MKYHCSMLRFSFLDSLGRRLDIALAALFMIFGSIPSILVFERRKYTFFYQNFTPESVMWACGQGLRHPHVISDQLAAFLLGRVQSFDCSTIDPTWPFGPAAVFASIQPWLTWLTALLWRMFGVSQTALLPLLALLAGLYAAGCYALSRLFLGRLLAVAAGVVLCVSPVFTEMVLFLRDYSKAPFFIWATFFLILALRPGMRRPSVVLAALAGASVGLGYGFRSDLAVLLPIGVAVLTVSAIAEWRRYSFSFRIFAPLAFLATAAVFALPVLAQTNVFATNAGTLAIQGTTEYFRDYAELKPAGYALGWSYSDELTLSEVTSAERPQSPGWDEREGQPYYDVTQAIQYSTSYLLGWAPLFAADFATQALKSAGWIFGFPSLFMRSDMPWAQFTSAYLLPMYDVLAKPWMPVVVLIGFIALLWRSYLRSPMEAACTFLLLAFLVCYPGIQLAIRHVFHLEFVWVVSILSLVSVIVRPAFPAKPARGFAVMVSVIVVAIGASYLGLIAWQRTILMREVADLLTAPREPLETRPQIKEDGDAFYALPVPAQHTKIVASAADSLTPALRLIGIGWNVRAEADRLSVTVGGDGCPTGMFKVRLAYEKRTDAWQPLDADLSLDITGKGASASAFFPAFYRPTQHFSGILLPSSHVSCTLTLERIDTMSLLPLVMSGQFSQSQLVGPLTKGFGGFVTTSHTPGIIQSAPKKKVEPTAKPNTARPAGS
jgi:4-amino-4-deoxy-L-arabinose transferase-like glycosyltransferase